MIQFKKIREPLLIVSGLVLAGLVVWFCIALLLFLGRVLDASLSFEQRSVRPGEFDIATFEELNLMQEQRSGSVPRPIVEKKAVVATTTIIISTSTATSSNPLP